MTWFMVIIGGEAAANGNFTLTFSIAFRRDLTPNYPKSVCHPDLMTVNFTPDRAKSLKMISFQVKKLSNNNNSVIVIR